MPLPGLPSVAGGESGQEMHAQDGGARSSGVWSVGPCWRLRPGRSAGQNGRPGRRQLIIDGGPLSIVLRGGMRPFSLGPLKSHRDFSGFDGVSRHVDIPWIDTASLSGEMKGCRSRTLPLNADFHGVLARIAASQAKSRQVGRDERHQVLSPRSRCDKDQSARDTPCQLPRLLLGE